MVTTQMSGVITMRIMFLIERLEKVYVPDEDSLEQKNEHFPWPALQSLQR